MLGIWAEQVSTTVLTLFRVCFRESENLVISLIYLSVRVKVQFERSVSRSLFPYVALGIWAEHAQHDRTQICFASFCKPAKSVLYQMLRLSIVLSSPWPLCGLCRLCGP